MSDGEQAVYSVLNHDGVARTVTLDGRWRDLISGAELSGQCELASYDVRLLVAPPRAVPTGEGMTA